MGRIVERAISLDLPAGKSAFLWGPRRVGKSYWLRTHYGRCPLIDLLQTDVFAAYASRPALLRERYLQHRGEPIVIDEVQKVPALLDEVHWLIENTGQSFILTGSSARKLRRGHANLLAGRAWRRQMLPLCWPEVEDFELEPAMTSGLLPPHFLSPQPVEELRAYVADYLKEEIVAESLPKNLPAFSEFLRVAAVTSGELLNYTNVGRESGVSAKVVRTYFEILEDTYLGYRLSPWTRSRRYRLIETEKFYLFDVGVTNYLARRRPATGSPEFGKAFEHFVFMELKAYQAYRQPELDLWFWRTSTGQEVDFVVGDMMLAIEVKGSSRVHEGDTRALRALAGERRVKRRVIVSLEAERRLLEDGTEAWPWQQFLEALWGGELGV